jgi:hypothetical protein
MTPSPGPDWVAFIAQTGVAGAVLVWFMFRTEGILKRNIDSIDRLSRSMLLMIIALKQAPPGVKDQATEIVRELDQPKTP